MIPRHISRPSRKSCSTDLSTSVAMVVFSLLAAAELLSDPAAVAAALSDRLSWLLLSFVVL